MTPDSGLSTLDLTPRKDRSIMTYDLQFNIGALKRVKRLLNVDLFDVVSAPTGGTSGSSGTSGGGEDPTMARLSTDVSLLVDVCYAILKPQLDAQDIDDEAFGASLDGEKFAQLREQFFRGLGSFFTASGRPDQAIALQRMLKTEAIAIGEVQARIDAIDCASLVSQVIASGTSSTSSPASADSTPTP
jgi:hypothetical protein